MRSVTREEMREIDRRAIEEFGIPALILMEHAGKAVAEAVASRFPPGSKVAVVCGKKNNGGDGFVCARHLANRGYGVKVVTLADAGEFDAQSPAGINRDILIKMGLKIMPVAAEGRVGFLSELLRSSDVIVDAIFGTGLSKPVEGLFRSVIDVMNSAGKPVVAVDIPTGLDCNEGVPLGAAVRATCTVTMGLSKAGFAKPGAAQYTGEVIVADIGFPRALLRAYD